MENNDVKLDCTIHTVHTIQGRVEVLDRSMVKRSLMTNPGH